MEPKQVLLIDDNEMDNYINEFAITESKMARTITSITSAKEALVYLNRLQQPEEFPDVIFLDIRMPQMDGFGFLEHYHQLPEILKSKCFIFMLSSSLDKNDIERATQNPYVKKYLSKPLEADVIAALWNHQP